MNAAGIRNGEVAPAAFLGPGTAPARSSIAAGARR